MSRRTSVGFTVMIRTYRQVMRSSEIPNEFFVQNQVSKRMSDEVWAQLVDKLLRPARAQSGANTRDGWTAEYR